MRKPRNGKRKASSAHRCRRPHDAWGHSPRALTRGPRRRWTEDAIGRVDDAGFAKGATSVIGPSTSI